ncbi:MAG: hypothetical protein CMG46_07910 [Candidatus Marinimicrobia bacterium]|nr:hypothetical protein [Candidatus Neomarinimicrobiota bacterium]
MSDIFDPSFLRKDKDLQGLFLTLLKGGLHKQARDSVGMLAAHYVRQRTKDALASAKEPVLSDKNQQNIELLRKQGFAVIDPIFEKQDIISIESFVANLKVHFGSVGFDESGRKGEMHVSELPPNIRFAHYQSTDICNCPAIYKAVHNEQLISTAAKYLGAPPTISSVASWWSFPSTLPVGGMQMFHHDRGDFRSCNLFVYLTDVSEVTGPHSFVTGTHEFDVLYPLAMKRFGGNSDTFQKFWRWMEVHRKSDDDISLFFKDSEIKIFTGPKGTSFLEDTRGLHKATVPISGPRLAFEIVFTVWPKFEFDGLVGLGKQSSLPREHLEFKTDSQSISPLVRYATRLMYN